MPKAAALGVMAKLSPERRTAINKRVKALAQEEMTLADLRKAQSITQASLARKLGVNQSSVSQVESSTDLYLSTLRKHIEAMGGELTLTASFPDRDAVIITDIRRDHTTQKETAPVKGRPQQNARSHRACT